MPLISLFGIITKLLLLILGLTLLLPYAIEATLNLDSISAQISTLSSLITDYYSSLSSSLSSISTTLTTITTDLTAISTTLSSQAITLQQIITLINNLD